MGIKKKKAVHLKIRAEDETEHVLRFLNLVDIT